MCHETENYVPRIPTNERSTTVCVHNSKTRRIKEVVFMSFDLSENDEARIWRELTLRKNFFNDPESNNNPINNTCNKRY